MTEPLFVDTGYILALVNENDQHHAEALGLSEHFDGHPIVITDAVLLEIGNALSRVNRGAAVQIIEDLRNTLATTIVNLSPDRTIGPWQRRAVDRSQTRIVVARPLTQWAVPTNGGAPAAMRRASQPVPDDSPATGRAASRPSNRRLTPPSPVPIMQMRLVRVCMRRASHW